ncbi:MAG: ASCH domain-containing protein [Caldilineaceae bacterium]
MNPTNKTDAFWQTYLTTLPANAKAHTQPYTVWDFADTPEAATTVGNLVRQGIKTTTSSLMWGLEHIGEPLPQVGELAVVVDGTGEPLCVIEVIEVEIKPFNAVDEEFAFAYGEGDRTLADWRRDNWEYLARWCVEIGRIPSETMPLGCQRFRLLYSAGLHS